MCRAAKHVSAIAISWALLGLALFSPPFIKQTEAGGKGKGGRGHIIVQNEVKGNQVPVYMPIPIPVPMPMGPPPPPPPPPPHQHQEEDGEGEVRKIYLLQPMPRPRPQPHLKGGGFMGPIQNHIHLGSQDQFSSPAKHRHAGGYGNAGGAHQQHQHSQEGDADVRTHERHGAIKSASSDVKILPIVVIPPVAPMPPIQVPNSPSGHSTSNTHRLMFSPQFNNFLVAGDRMKRHGRHHSSYRTLDSFADYGGSVGGSVFRENYGGRARWARNRAADASNHQGASSSRSRDFDYADFDYDTSPSSFSRSDEPPHLPRKRYYRVTSSGLFPVQRRHQRQFSAQPREVSSLNSIRDIIEAHRAARFQDYDQAVNSDRDPPLDFAAGENEPNGLAESQFAGPLNSRPSRNQSPASFEISLDDLSNQLASADSQQHNRVQKLPGATSNNQDLSSLYYDHGQPAVSSSKLAAKAADGVGLERDIFEEDQWRFDSIKSIKHVAAGATMTSGPNSTNSTDIGQPRQSATPNMRRTKPLSQAEGQVRRLDDGV